MANRATAWASPPPSRAPGCWPKPACPRHRTSRSAWPLSFFRWRATLCARKSSRHWRRRSLEILTWRPVPVRPDGPGRNRECVAAGNLARVDHGKRSVRFRSPPLPCPQAVRAIRASRLCGQHFVRHHGLQGALRRAAAGRLLSRSCPSRVQDAVRAFSPAIRDQRAAFLEPCPTLPHACAQRRDQHHLGQPRLHGCARGHAAARSAPGADRGRLRLHIAG